MTCLLGLLTMTCGVTGDAMAKDMEMNFSGSWAARAFAAEPATAPPSNRLQIVHEDAVGDTKIGRCAFGGPMRLGEKVYTRGIGVNSHSVLRVSLEKPAKAFLADIGLDRNVDNTVASVRFHVAVGGTDVFTTDVMRPSDGVRSIEVPLQGSHEFDLVVDVGGDERSFDQADWADARVVLEDGTTLWLDDLARAWSVQEELPFSFVYGGKPSTELLGSWKREAREERVDATRNRRIVTLTDPATSIEVRAEAIVYTDTGGVDWTLYFANKGAEDSEVLEQVKAVDVAIHPGVAGNAVLHRLNGSMCAVDDWLPFDQPLPAGQRVDFAATNGRSSNVCPFFNLAWDGGGVITAIGWSGQWAASVANADRTLRVQAGLQNMHLKLRPGETIRSPRILQLYWFGDDPWRGYNQWRRIMFAHVMPHIDGKPATPPIVHLSTSFYEMNASTEQNVLSHLEPIKDLGFELFWLDAYWTRDGFPNGMGHYGFPIERAEPHDRFPRGLRPISDAARDAGMGFLMWFEPERVAAGTALAKERPEWVISPNNDGSGLFNLGIPEAREYMTQYLTTVIKEYGLAWLRIDYNIDPLPFWEFLSGKDPDRVGIAEIRYVEGLYRMWDAIRAAHPQLLIDNCASGGRRIDLETCSRSIPLWRTDATIDPLMRHDFDQSALQNQVMTAGLSRYVPFSVSGQMGATPYLFRSGFNAGIAFCEDCRSKEYPRDQLRQAIAEGKRIRKYYFGNFYTLSDVKTSSTDWCVMQYHRPEKQDGMVMAFRRHQSPYSAFSCELREIVEQAAYEVACSSGYDAGAAQQMIGADLMRLNIEIPERPGSLLIEYQRKDSAP